MARHESRAVAASAVSNIHEPLRYDSIATVSSMPPESATELTICILSQTGSRTNVTLSPYKTVGDIKQTLVAAWPNDFGESPTRAGQVRLIHSGKILNDEQAVETLKTPEGLVNIHASVRPASLAAGDQIKESKKPGCCVVS